MTRYETCLNKLFLTEGGYNDRKADRGGPTNLGISLRFAQAARHTFNFDLDGDGDVDKNDIKLIRPEHAKIVYKILFWDAADCGKLPAPIDGMVFDQAVNAGPETAVKLLQRALNRMAPSTFKLAEDGHLGPLTLNAVLTAVAANRSAVIKAYKDVVITRYKTIAANDPSQRANLNGWINRANHLGEV